MIVDPMVKMPVVFPVTCHTDFVGINTTFVAIEGYSDNGVRYIRQAIDKGARTIVTHNDVVLDDELKAYMEHHNVTLCCVDNTRKALADLSAQAAGYPARQVKIIGITGTKGKTTTSFLLEHIIRAAGYKTALLSSVSNKIMDVVFPSSLTTPQPDYLQQFLKLCFEQSVEYVVMEVAAQAISLHRVKDIEYDGFIFTNFSHEHLEFYDDLESYFNAKCLIFESLKKGSPLLINADNVQGKQLLGKYPKALSYGFHDADTVYRGMYRNSPVRSLSMTIKNGYNSSRMAIIECLALFGEYNGYNVTAAISMALELNITSDVITHALRVFSGVPGRLQQTVLRNGARSFIDYAHNPESFYAVLSTLRLLTDNLIVVFGAGGGRDKIKRPLMGSIAADIADKVILTTDNPRLEDPSLIVNDIRAGIASSVDHKVYTILDREEAIRYAYECSSSRSIIALLGKGPDEYQIIGTKKYYFSEQRIIQQLV